MDYLFENVGTNWGVIFSDVLAVYLPLFSIAFMLMCFWAANNYKRSIAKEYEERIDHLRLKNLNQGIEIERLNSELRLAKEGFTQYKDDAMIEILNLRNELKESNEDRTNMRSKLQSRRNPNGTFAVTTGKGHSKKKRDEIKTTESETTDRDWTKATKEELLAEAKRRYPVGTKIICLHDQPYDLIETNIFRIDSNGYCIRNENKDGYVNCVYHFGKWAKIIK